MPRNDRVAAELATGHAAATATAPGNYSKRYRNYILGALTAVYALNAMDRYIIGVLVQPIKAEFALSDSQIGALGGISFAIFYVTFGLPIAWLADRFNRVKIMTICIALWSLATAACGLAANFVQLIVARTGVGIGEGGATPPAYSIISDLWPPNKRASATAVFVAGAPFGSAVGLLLAGWINEFWGWRAAFLILGLAGIPIALVVLTTIREPVRGLTDMNRPRTEDRPPLFTSLRQILRSPAFVFMTLATSCTSFTIYALSVWLPTFFVRSHLLSGGEAGSIVAAMSFVGMGCGSILGGVISDGLLPRDRRWAVWLPALCFVLCAPLLAFGFDARELPVSIALISLAHFLLPFYYGPVFSTIQLLVDLRVRATAVSLFLFVCNLVGLGLGPWIVGIAADHFAAAGEAGSLRLALTLCLAPSLMLGACLHMIAGVRLRENLSAIEQAR